MKDKKTSSKNSLQNKFNDFYSSINTNKLFIGISMIFLNIGSRYIELKLTKSQEMIMKNIARELLIFSVAFIGSRDIIVALIITSLFVIFSKYFFNEESKYNILPEKYKQLSNVLDTNHDGVISQDEIDNALKILKKANEEDSLHKKINMLNNISE